jgi:hypothetical protein
MRSVPAAVPTRTSCPSSRNRAALLLLSALTLAVSAGAQAPAAQEQPNAEPTRPRRVDARADEIMKKMGAFLAQVPRFALEAEEQIDEVAERAPRLQLTNVRRVAVARPDRMAADATGDTLNRVAVYDGHTLSVLDKDRNAYFTAEAPATIDATLDAVAERLGIVVPLSDLVYADPYAVLMEGVLYGEYRGIHQAAGVACHHLAFTQEDIEWQIWIDAGDEPLPRKLLIAYVDERGVPQYSATVKRWSLKPAFTDELFRFEPPEGATRIDVGPAELKANKEAEAPKAEEKP